MCYVGPRRGRERRRKEVMEQRARSGKDCLRGDLNHQECWRGRCGRVTGSQTLSPDQLQAAALTLVADSNYQHLLWDFSSWLLFLSASNSTVSQRGDRPSCPLLFQQGAQLAPTGEPLGPLYVHCTHLTGHSALFSGVPACWTQNTFNGSFWKLIRKQCFSWKVCFSTY